MLGCAPRVAQRELALESRFDAALDRNDIRNWIQRMSSAPNGVGSPHDKANAEWMLKQFRTWGLDAHIAKCEVLFPVSEARGLALVAPTRCQAQLRKPPVPALDFRPLIASWPVHSATTVSGCSGPRRFSMRPDGRRTELRTRCDTRRRRMNSGASAIGGHNSLLWGAAIFSLACVGRSW